MAFSGVFSWHDFGDLLPIVVVEVFNKFGVFYHEGEEAILEQMRLVILPLRQSSQTLSRIFLLLK